MTARGPDGFQLETSFLRRIPSAMSLEQRLLLEALCFAIDTLHLSYIRVRAAALQHPPQDIEKEMPWPTRLSMFSAAWSMIDQAHVIRTVLKDILRESTEPVFQSFVDRYIAATNLRNAMDHLPQNLPNLSQLKARRPPIYGAISYCYVRSLNGEGVGEATIMTLTAGSLTHDKHSFATVNPAGKLMELPAGLFQLAAFKDAVELSQLAIDAEAIADHFHNSVRPVVEKQIREYAEKSGADVDTLLAPKAATLTVGLNVKFGDHSTPPESS